MDLSGSLSNSMSKTRLNGVGWFDIDKDFLKKKENSKISSAMMLGESFLKKSKDKEGKYHFNLSGNVSNPRFKLSKNGGKSKKKSKKSKRK